jgi:bifunctional oligoribonuclease and PAP phosphatase NrnA
MGISTDTGHFQRGKDLATTFSLASFLLSKGADLHHIVNNIYRANDYAGTKFVGELMQRIVHEEDLIRVSVSQPELEKNNLDEAKIEMLLHIMTDINHDGIFLLFKHYPLAHQPYLKCSFRTKNPDIDLSLLAQQFGWGWHRAAAACRVMSDDLEKTQQAIIKLSKSYHPM